MDWKTREVLNSIIDLVLGIITFAFAMAVIYCLQYAPEYLK
jgi:hypothetical protein